MLLSFKPCIPTEKITTPEKPCNRTDFSDDRVQCFFYSTMREVGALR